MKAKPTTKTDCKVPHRRNQQLTPDQATDCRIGLSGRGRR
jgi:hypothetical protein